MDWVASTAQECSGTGRGNGRHFMREIDCNCARIHSDRRNGRRRRFDRRSAQRCLGFFLLLKRWLERAPLATKHDTGCGAR